MYATTKLNNIKDYANVPFLDKIDEVRGQKKLKISAKERYFASLNSWVKLANLSQNAMAMFPLYLLNNYPQIFQTQVPTSDVGILSMVSEYNSNQQVPNTNANTNLNEDFAIHQSPRLGGFRILNERAQAELINHSGGYEYVIAPFWKRGAAEVIDVFILLLLKILITFTIMNLFELDLGIDIDKEVLRKVIDDEDYTGFLAISMDFLAFSSDLLMLEVLTKMIVCFYEAIWTSTYGGATPGKAVMNLRIQYVEAVLPLQILQPQPLGVQVPRIRLRALIYPAQTPDFKRAFLRALVKNLIMTLLFPMCFIMIFFKHNRTAYDVITKTIVVENNPNPIMRPPSRTL